MLSSKLINQVTYLLGDEVPINMSFASFGSQILLVGGRSVSSKTITINDRKPTYLLDTKDPKPRFIPTKKIPELEDCKYHPWVQEISGKLYALSVCSPEDPTPFDILADAKHDPKWAPLSGLPLHSNSHLNALDYSSCGVVGTKIFVFLPIWWSKIRTFCFDVAHPDRPWTIHDPLCSDNLCAFPGPYSKVLLLDLEDDKEKLMFSYDCDSRVIRVSSMMLSDGGNPVSITSAGIIVLETELPVPPGFNPHSYSFVHLGGKKICFLSMNRFIITVFTFEFSYSPFSFKPLGCLLFDFQFHRQFNAKKPTTRGVLAGCFVL